MIDYKNIKYDPKFEWLQEQERIHGATEEHPWLWDNDKAALFLFADLYNEGIKGLNHLFTFWFSMMLKQMDEPYLSFMKEYIETGVRKYTYDLGGITPFEAMKKFGLPYVYAIMQLHEEKHPDIYGIDENNTMWAFPESRSKNGDDIISLNFHYIVLNEDGNGYTFMSKERIYVEDLYEKRTISEQDYQKLIGMSQDELLEVYDKIQSEDRHQGIEWLHNGYPNGEKFHLDLSGVLS